MLLSSTGTFQQDMSLKMYDSYRGIQTQLDEDWALRTILQIKEKQTTWRLDGESKDCSPKDG